MLLKVSEELNLGASQDEVWKLLRDTPRLVALLPGVEKVTPLVEPGAEVYQAKAGDKVGPFKVALNLEIRVTEARPPVSLKAGIKGADSIGLNRITGSLHITLIPVSPTAQMRFEAEIEILGKLATLGAAPVRRRVTERFAEFARNIQAQFAPDAGPNLRAQSATDARAGLRTQSKKDRR
jgi:carbon monoxide dehydrogenase subunit G